jgi:cell division protease FtsH
MSDMKPDSSRRRNGGRREGGPGGPGGSGQGGPGGPNARLTRTSFAWLVLIAMTVVLAVLMVRVDSNPETLDLAAFNDLLNSFRVKSLTTDGVRVLGTKRDWAVQEERKKAEAEGKRIPPEKFTVKLPPGYLTPEKMDAWTALVRAPDPQNKNGNPSGLVEYNDSNVMIFAFLWQILPFVVLVVIAWFFLLRQLKAGAGGGGMLSFGKTRGKFLTKEHVNITFDDVAGIDEAKDEVREIIEFLKNPKRFARLGGRIPRGVLLVGEPGCGKTLLAKAIAGEADVPFISICGSDFVEMFVGVGASRVRDLFKQAKENSPCIVFLDEIDAVGRRRGSGFQSGGHDEREQTLNAILVEMDGFETNDQVIVIAATNRSDVLDPALKRPGRFDRQIVIPLPDVKGRLEILKVHIRNVKLSPAVDLERIARATVGFAGAELAALVNEAALAATMANKEAIELSDLEEARDKLKMGRARRSRVVSEEDRRQTAVHEAGHALLAHLLPDAIPLHKVSIIPRGPAGGITWAMPERDIFTLGRKRVFAEIKKCLGGRIAEELFGIDNDSGVAGDIRQATGYARAMVCEWGMSDKLGFVHYARDGEGSGMESYLREYSEATAQTIDAEVRKIIDAAYAETRALLEARREDIQRLADALLRYETLDRAEVEKVLAGESLDHKLPKPADKRPEPPALRPAAEPTHEPALPPGVPLPQAGA